MWFELAHGGVRSGRIAMKRGVAFQEPGEYELSRGCLRPREAPEPRTDIPNPPSATPATRSGKMRMPSPNDQAEILWRWSGGESNP